MFTAELGPKTIVLFPAFDLTTFKEGGMTKEQKDIVQSKMYSGLTEVFSPNSFPAYMTARILSRHIGLAMRPADLEPRRLKESSDDYIDRLAHAIKRVETSWMRNAALVAPQDVINDIGRMVGITRENTPLTPGKLYEVTRDRKSTL
ncbi:MAG: hypothetical protein KA035_04310 [Candidatus Levybacteria bacterium]|nr:hypothetical protein [Candidatus Levybacteria bacterium]